MDAVRTFQNSLGLGLHLCHVITFACREAENVHTRTNVVCLLQRGVGHQHRCGGIAANAYSALSLAAHTHHGIINAVYLERFSTRILRQREQFLMDTRPDDTHLAALCNVHFVYTSSVNKFGVVHSVIFGKLSADTDIAALGFVQCGTPPDADGGRNHIGLGHSMAQTLHIRYLYRPPASLAEALIGFAGLLAEHKTGIGSEAGEVGGQQIFHPLSTAHKEQKHEDTPKDAERRQERTRLIAQERFCDFAPLITVYSYGYHARNASMGFTLDALCAGKNPATAPDIIMTSVAHRQVVMSTVGSTKYCILSTPKSNVRLPTLASMYEQNATPANMPM